MPRVTEIEITTDIRRVARLIGHSPSSVEYREHGRYDLRTVQRRFGEPWARIIGSAGLRYTSRTYGRFVSAQEVRRDLERVARLLGHTPTCSEYEGAGRFGVRVVKRRAGERRWEGAVAALTGVDREEVMRRQQRGGCYRTTGEWLGRLKELSHGLGHAPTTRESNEGGINAHELCKRVGGKWVDVLGAAGIELGTRGEYARLRSTSTDELLEDVVRVSRRLGRPAKAREYERWGRFPHLPICRRMGGWRNVKRAVARRLAEMKGVAGMVGEHRATRVSVEAWGEEVQSIRTCAGSN